MANNKLYYGTSETGKMGNVKCADGDILAILLLKMMLIWYYHGLHKHEWFWFYIEE